MCCLLFRLNDDVYILKSVPETMDKKFKFDEFVMIVDVGRSWTNTYNVIWFFPFYRVATTNDYERQQTMMIISI